MTTTENLCVVPGSNIELYDCCKALDGSTLHTTCDSIGGLNSLALTLFLGISLAVIFGVYQKKIRSWITTDANKCLILVCFFHCLSIVWRALLYFKVGHPEFKDN
jgi:hypothetical protein